MYIILKIVIPKTKELICSCGRLLNKWHHYCLYASRDSVKHILFHFVFVFLLLFFLGGRGGPNYPSSIFTISMSQYKHSDYNYHHKILCLFSHECGTSQF